MKIVLLGSGNVATHLAQALKSKGEEIVQIYSQNLNHAQLLADRIPCESIDNLKAIKTDADLYIIAVKDDAIESIADHLKAVSGLVVHTSGTTDIQVLSSKVKHAGVLYPLQTFSKTKEVSFEEIPLCIEATDESHLSILQNLASKLSQQVYHLGGDQRKVLHLAAVFACNFTNHLYTLAHQLLQQNDLDFEIIRPLIKETADKVMVSLPEKVQTGPAARGDETTLNKHFSMLNNMPELQHIYQTLSDSIKFMPK
ncbi:putative short-subunit dehydrogenase-like oxidoreductase (DUF2520 family) [Pedobacter psychrotolerans]|uniref:Putative short-subunit dehydrogenase-like oxidoreductase (DUF2520 family) n=1 Tax=Pedobacter psychrotolerans TaxID=1843235 RepID=A0A4R2H4W3_9SPHI|nr:Rossmann-like and DUF2520 domain-containing protein [Pedobacter psychrotolerans]TCO20652.1 putative short-subunit dehydrogenase-like oxidoreductase (DUF2520 family) [Pedobacter psychrotolerans]GGE67084.1 hypothetical protein GCM10011413_37120 [Pedobacter psychrotolerans]